MKRYCPIWMIAAIVCILLSGAFSIQLLRSTEEMAYELKTITGDESILSSIQVNAVIANSYKNYLTSNIGFGKKLSVQNSYTDNYFNEFDIPSNKEYHGIQIDDTIMNLKQFPSETAVINTTDLAATIPFELYYSNQKGEYNTVSFPYVTIPTTKDMKIYTQKVDSDGYSIRKSHSFYIGNSGMIFFQDKSYFTITDISCDLFNDEEYKDFDYTITSGIFEIKNGKLENIYKYLLTDEEDKEVLSLFPVADRNCLGLLVREGNKIILKLFDVTKRELVSDSTLFEYKRDQADNSHYNEYFNAIYNPSSSTLLISSSYSIPTADQNELDKLYALVEKTTDQMDYDKVNDKIDALFEQQEGLKCYTLDDANTPVYRTSLDSSTMKAAKNKVLKEQFLQYITDGIYRDGILYIVSTPYNTVDESIPYIVALKDAAFLYEGYLVSDIDQDYMNSRHKSSYINTERYSSYDHFLRYYSKVTLSLKN